MQDISIAPSSIECLVTPSQPSERHLPDAHALAWHASVYGLASCTVKACGLTSGQRTAWGLVELPCLLTICHCDSLMPDVT